MIKGAIFDADGTLLDSMGTWNTAAEKYLIHMGYKPKPDLYSRIKGMTLAESSVYFQKEYGVTQTYEEIRKGIDDIMWEYYHNSVTTKPGIKEFLQKLSENGVKMCVATASGKNLIEEALRHCGIAQYFEFVISTVPLGTSKHEHLIYQTAMEQLGTDKSNTVVFEDVLYAAQAAKNGGFMTVSIYDEYEKKQDEIKAITDFNMTDFTDVKAFLDFAAKLK